MIENKQLTRFAAVAGVLTLTALAGADQAYSPAAICSWDDGNGARVRWGKVENNSTSGRANLNCGITYGGSPSSFDLTVDYWDQNSGSGSTNAVYCRPQKCSETGGTCSYEPGRYSCSTEGGCSSGSSSFTGAGTLAWSGLTRNTNAFHGMYCLLPAKAEGRSNVGRIFVEE